MKGKKQIAAEVEILAEATEADAALIAEDVAWIDGALSQMAEHAAREDVLLAEAMLPECTEARLEEIAGLLADLEIEAEQWQPPGQWHGLVCIGQYIRQLAAEDPEGHTA